MDAGTREVKVLAGKRGHRWDRIIRIIFDVTCDFGNVLRMHTIHCSTKGRIFEDHCLNRHISGTFADTEQGAVDGTCAIHPGCRGIDDTFVEIIVAVPFDHIRRHAGIMLQSVDDAGNTSRQRNAGIRNTEAKGVAGSDLNRNAAFARYFHQAAGKRYDKAVKISTRNILKMAAWAKSGFDTVANDAYVFVESLFSGKSHFMENMVIRAADEHTGFFYSDRAHQLKIFFRCPNPSGNFRKTITEFHTFFQGITVFFRIDKKFGLADHAIVAAELVKQFVQMNHLLRRIRSTRLLAIAECRVGDENVIRHILRHTAVVECNFRRFIIRKHFVK